MAIVLNDNLQINAGKPIDSRYFNASGAPYGSVSEVLSTIGGPLRYQGLTVNVMGAEYWFQNGVSNSNLVLKSNAGTSGGSSSVSQSYFENGITTSNGTAGLGGTLVRDTAIDGAYAMNVGISQPLTQFNVLASSGVGLELNDGTNDNSLGFYGNLIVMENVKGAYNTQIEMNEQFAIMQAINSTSGYATSIIVTNDEAASPSVVKIAGTYPNFAGAQYAADYSGHYTNRSLVDKQYVDNKANSGVDSGTAGWAMAAQIAYSTTDTASNGITKSGNNFQLGGTLTQNTSLTGNTYDVTVSAKGLTVNEHGDGIYLIDNNGGGVFLEENGGGVFLQGTTGGIYLQQSSGGGISIGRSIWNNGGVYIQDRNLINITGLDSSGSAKYSLSFDGVSGTPSAVFNDSTASPKGLQYGADYSSTYTSRSLVDKNYVDNKVSSASNGTSGWATNAANAYLLNNNNAAYYLNRSNQTGTQTVSTISDLGINGTAAWATNVAFAYSTATTASNGITKTSNNYALGGTFTGNTLIDDSTYQTNSFLLGSNTPMKLTYIESKSIGFNAGTSGNGLLPSHSSITLNPGYGLYTNRSVFTTYDNAVEIWHDSTSNQTYSNKSNVISDVLILQNSISNGTAGDNFGSAIRFKLEDNTNVVRDAGTIDMHWYSSSVGGIGEMSVGLDVAGTVKEAMRIGASYTYLGPTNNGNYVINANGSGTQFLAVDSYNISIFQDTPTFGGGIGVLYLQNATTVPTTSVTSGGGVLFSDPADSHVKWRTGSTTYDLTAAASAISGSTSGWANNAGYAYSTGDYGTNGIVKNGNGFSLGGRIYNDTKVLGDGYNSKNLYIGDNGSNFSDSFSQFSLKAGNILISDGGGGTIITSNSGAVNINGNNGVGITTNAGYSATVTGFPMKYAADYSVYYDARSLVDKGYVDAKTVSGTAGWATNAGFAYSIPTTIPNTTTFAANISVQGQAYTTPQTLSVSNGTAGWNMNLGGNATITLNTANTWIVPSNIVAGATYNLTVVQDANGSRGLSWPSAQFKWPGGGTAPTLSVASSSEDQFTFYTNDGIKLRGNAALNYK